MIETNENKIEGHHPMAEVRSKEKSDFYPGQLPL
jgi:hypothetical protein